MYTIGEFSKKLNLSARALRLYEEKGLIRPSYRGENGYRFFQEDLLPKVKQIQNLKALGFSLDEIRKILILNQRELRKDLELKLSKVQNQIVDLQNRQEEIQNLLSVTDKIDQGNNVNQDERRIYMDAIKEEVIKLLGKKVGNLTEKHLDFIERDKGIYDSSEKIKFLEVVRSCVQFAKERNLLMGPGRGSSPASVIMYGLGFGKVDPTKYGLIPERFIKDAPDLHIDIEFEKGQEFVDFCREQSKKLSYGQINAFKMPLLNIIDNVHKRLGKVVDYDSLSDDDDIVLSDIRKGDIDKIFCLDMSPDALVMKYENFFNEYVGTDKLKDYIKSQEICSFVDVLNIISIWRPNTQEMIERIYRYRDAKKENLSYEFLSPTLKEYLKPNFGQIIYHEDIIKILKEYTDWDYDKCSVFRRDIFKSRDYSSELNEFRKMAPKEVVDLVLSECKWTFCKSHTVAFSQLIKQTAVLKNLHKDIYFEEIQKWEQHFGYKWDDIGIRMKGVSLLQH
jgi:DNA polymerase III alpha subunit